MSGRSLGPQISKAEREEARQQRREERREEQDENTARQLASGAATQQGTAAPGYWNEIADPDLDHPEWGDALEPFVQAELSRSFAFGNISRKEWRNMGLRIENEFWQIQNEMKGPDTTISDSDMRMLYGEDRADLDDSKARRLRSAREVKKNIASLSVDARGHKGGTEIHAVARTEDGDADGEDAGGLMSGLASSLAR